MLNATHTTTSDLFIAGRICPKGTRVAVLRKGAGKIVHVVTEHGNHARISGNALRAI